MSKIYFILATSHSGEILVLMYSVGQQSGETLAIITGRAQAGLKS